MNTVPDSIMSAPAASSDGGSATPAKRHKTDAPAALPETPRPTQNEQLLVSAGLGDLPALKSALTSGAEANYQVRSQPRHML